MSALAVVSRPTEGDTDDRELVAGVRAGDDRAFELLFQRYQPRIAAYVRGMVHDHGRAEDITQEVFISALRRMREDSDREILFKPWIYEIAKNKCIDAYRRTRNASEVSFDARDAIGADEHGRLAVPGVTPDSAIEGKVAIDNLCGAFGGLSPVHHDILVLRELEGLSYREIGERLGMSRPAVESTLFRARKRLSEEYEELVSGERCLRIQCIVDASCGRSAGQRDQRRMARHLAHCQPCRRYAGRAGIDFGAVSRPAAAAARVAAFLPLPAFLRRRWGGDEAAPLLGDGGAAGQWSANVAAVVDPGMVSSWTKAVATAATVAVAGVGAGGALSDRAATGAILPGSPFAQAPSLGLFASGDDDRERAARPAHAAEPAAVGGRQQRGAQPAHVGAGAPGSPGRSSSAAPAPPAGGAPPAPGSSHADKAPGRPADAGADPAPRRGTTATGTQADSGAPDPAKAVDDVLGAVGTAGGSASGAGATATAAGTGGSAGTGSSGPAQGVTAPDVDTVGAVKAQVRGTVDSVLPQASGVTAVVGSVSSTVPATLTSTTTASHDVGG